MASYSINVKQDLAGTMERHILKTPLVRNNQYAHVFNVEVTNNGVPYPVGSVEANFVQSNGMTVPLDSTYCSSSGNVATVRLPQACYTVPGRAILVINCEADGGITCIAWFDCTVLNGSTENALDPGTIIPSVETLIDRIDDAVESIPADYSQLLASISDNFSAETPWAVGAYVWGPSNATHPGALYRFTSAHSGSWVETDATIVVIGNELNDTVRYTQQVHTDAEKAIARTNMGAAAAADLTALSNSVGTVPAGTTVENQIFSHGTQISTNASNIDALQRQVGTVPTGETVEGQIGDLKSAIGKIEGPATSADEGKSLLVKTVSNGKVTAWEYGEGVTIDSTLTQAGEAADAKVVGDVIAAIEPGLTSEAKSALLACFRHVVWVDEHGQDYYDDLYDALYNTGKYVVSLSAVYTQTTVVYGNDDISSLKDDLVVTAVYSDASTREIPSSDYTLSGVLVDGNSTITVKFSGKTTTFVVSVTWVPAEYQIVEYIEGTGTQYIQTNVLSQLPLSYDAELAITTETANTIFAASALDVANSRFVLTAGPGVYISDPSKRYLGMRVGADLYGYDPAAAVEDNSGWIKSLPAIVYGQKYNVHASVETNGNQTIQVNDRTPVSHIKELPSLGNPFSIFYLAFNNSIGQGRIYYVRLLSGNNVISYLIPCYRKQDSVAGVYDIINDAFYINVGTGTFVVGEDI